jgi:hypothetical protein
MPVSAKRRAGVRPPYADAPAELRAWVDDQLGSPVRTVIPRTGGMSPAVAATLVTASGERAFVKAVGSSINPDTPAHFRHEISVLKMLGPAPYRADLVAAYDDGPWVAMLLEDVDGDHPDWDDPADIDAVFDLVREQAAELTPMRDDGLFPTVSQAITRHLDTLEQPSPAERAALPSWARAGYSDLLDLIRAARDRIDGETLCHWDVRHDNLLIRRTDRQVVLVDWGMSRRGPWWGDAFVFGLEWAESDRFDRLLEQLDLTEAQHQLATGFLAALGAYLTMAATHPAPPGLPNLPSFRQELGHRCLIGVRRRLGL